MAIDDKMMTEDGRTGDGLPWVDRLVCSFLRQGLWIVLIPLFLFVSLPFLAPIAMAAGWTRIGIAINTIFIPFCHQLPQRSWFFFGDQLTYSLQEINQSYASMDPWQLRFFYGTPEMGWRVAWSDRMISFYFMTPVFGIIYALLRKQGRSINPLPLKIFLLTLLPLALDGLSHVANDLLYGISTGGFRDTNAWLAALTGNAFPALYAGDHLGTFNWWARLLTGLLAAWGTAFYLFPWLDRLLGEEYDRTCSGRLRSDYSGNRQDWETGDAHNG